MTSKPIFAFPVAIVAYLVATYRASLSKRVQRICRSGLAATD